MVLGTYVNVKGLTKYVRYECITNDCLAHWPPSAFAQFGLFTTTIGRLTHWPPSTFAKFSLSVTDQSESAQLVIRFVGHFMSSLSHDLQSTML